MSSPENRLRSSRHEHRLNRMLNFNYDQHMTIISEIVHLAESLENSPRNPQVTAAIYEGVSVDTDGRAMDISSLKNNGQVKSLDVHFHGGLDGLDSVRYELQPAIDAYFKTVNYAQTTHIVHPLTVLTDIEATAARITLPPLNDQLSVSPDALESALIDHAERHPHSSHTLSKRYEYHDLEDLNADMIIHDINSHIKHYVFDVHTHVQKDGNSLLVAGNYQFEVDSSRRSPTGRASLEVIANNPVTSEQRKRYLDVSPEESLLLLVSAAKRIHASLQSEDLAS